MLKKSIEETPEFIAGDATHLREILHPNNDPVKIGYSIAHAYISAKKSSLPHKLTGSEVYHIIAGIGIIHVEGKQQAIQQGDTIYVPPNSLQFVENTSDNDLIFICIVEPAWTKESEFVDD